MGLIEIIITCFLEIIDEYPIAHFKGEINFFVYAKNLNFLKFSQSLSHFQKVINLYFLLQAKTPCEKRFDQIICHWKL